MHKYFVVIMNLCDPRAAYQSFLNFWTPRNEHFVQYVCNTGNPFPNQWAIYLGTVPIQGIHTTNFIQSWHKNLKYHLLSWNTHIHLDKFTHIMVDNVVPDVQAAVHVNQLGFKRQRTTKFQAFAKRNTER